MKNLLKILFCLFMAKTYSQDTKIYSFRDVDKQPIDKKCEADDIIDKQKCFNKFIQRNFAKNLNPHFISKLNSESSSFKQNVLIHFVINKKGKTEQIKVRSSHKKLVKEIKRAIRKFPVVKPGMKNGESVATYFTLPFSLNI